MSFATIRGQDRVVESLQRALGRGRLAHALLFAGPAGVGKRTTARALATALLCPHQPGIGCGACEDCHLVEKGAHPDLFVEDLERAREAKSTATKLSIDQMRRARSQLALRPVRGEKKVGLIDQAELLTIDAQNALLKTLEEPSGQATLILISTNSDALLTTIRSRCQCILFAPLERDQVRELLIAESVEPEVASQAAALAEGSLDRARVLAEEGLLGQAAELRQKLDTLKKSSIPEILDLAAELSGPRGEKGRGQRQLSQAAVLDWCRDQLIEAAHRVPATKAPEDSDSLDPLRSALRRAERAYATTRELQKNANTHLAWDRLLLDLRESR